jgi:hypothetical protein
MAPGDPLFIVEVDDDCAAQLTGRTGCGYSSPPQPAGMAMELVRVLLGCPTEIPRIDDGPWFLAIPGGRRTIRVHVATGSGQLTL